MDPDLEPRSPDFSHFYAFVTVLKCAWKVPCPFKGVILLWKTEQLQEKADACRSTPLIAPWKFPARHDEFILRSSDRDFLPVVRLSPPIIINTASFLKRKRWSNVSNSEEEVLRPCYFYLYFQLLFYLEIISRKQHLLIIFCCLEDEHISVKCYFLWKTCTLC